MAGDAGGKIIFKAARRTFFDAPDQVHRASVAPATQDRQRLESGAIVELLNLTLLA